jgi:hypothetical protein
MRVVETLVGGGLLLVFAYLVFTNPNGVNTALSSSSKALSNVFGTLQGRPGFGGV